ncbi:hypothetical protein GCM10011529_31230 [Polymorphobacter glacialis]|uniref:phosphatidylserine decarboxylase n=1 Tax=Sandarakinorhabdus glacialis TaxID=1614636 RepID=A0A917A1U3_9SPHN|nr:hypothetical protein GCM10011529_31230 [Polymorphobacter glacialis]
MSDRLKIMVQHILPKQWLTRLAGHIARGQLGAMTTALIRWFVRRYGVDVREADNAEVGSYASFNDFFTRPLKPGVRPLADADFACPVDGAISQFGAIDDYHIVQAKGHRFTTTALVGGDVALAALFRHGSFANLYLSPRDYHRLHMPCDGRLLRMIHVPGALFSVNPVTARGVPRLFARNERWFACSNRRSTVRSSWCWWVPPSSAAWQRSGTASSTGPAPVGLSIGAITTGTSFCAKARKWDAFCLARRS